jgi:RNA polymerase sigma-70 factor (ECF subfamily)
MNITTQAGGEKKGVIDIVALWRKFHRLVFHWLYGMVGNAEDAKDLTICVYDWAWEHQDRYDPSRSSFCTWLHLIAHSEAVRFWRKRRLPWRSLDTLPESMEPTRDGPEAEHDVAAVKERLWRAVDDLPEPEREVMRLRFLDELTVREVAAKLHVCVRTVEYHEARAKALLRVKLRPE